MLKLAKALIAKTKKRKKKTIQKEKSMTYLLPDTFILES